jgi:peptidoglycan/xylan/chitin deacetylase (PgdA/CDA1 family)
MDWGMIRGLISAGLECGAHTMTHPRLATLDPEATCRELRDSRLLLEDRLGQPIRHLAYPFGSYDSTVRALAAETGYRSACSVRIGLSPGDDDPLALQRVPVLGTDSLWDFVCRLRTAENAAELKKRIQRRIRRLLHGATGTPRRA